RDPGNRKTGNVQRLRSPARQTRPLDRRLRFSLLAADRAVPRPRLAARVEGAGFTLLRPYPAATALRAGRLSKFQAGRTQICASRDRPSRRLVQPDEAGEPAGRADVPRG